MNVRALRDLLGEFPDDAPVDLLVYDADGLPTTLEVERVEAFEITRGPNRGTYVSVVAYR